jgi:hypothetical protein
VRPPAEGLIVGRQRDRKIYDTHQT